MKRVLGQIWQADREIKLFVLTAVVLFGCLFFMAALPYVRAYTHRSGVAAR